MKTSPAGGVGSGHLGNELDTRLHHTLHNEYSLLCSLHWCPLVVPNLRRVELNIVSSFNARYAFY
jgi:hypothetical protein